MLFSIYFSAFSALLVLALTTNHATAHPSPYRRSAGIKVPLRRQQDPDGVHPEILREYRIHHDLRRHAFLTGQEGPSDADLTARLEARASLIEKRLNSSDLGFIPPVTPTAPNTVGLDIPPAFYQAEISIGTPPQNYHVLVDTGSPLLWVAGEDCTIIGSSQGCGPKATLGSSSSSTFQQDLGGWNISYEAGDVAGTFAQDVITFAGFSISATVGVGTELDASVAGFTFDGILGLSPDSTNGVPSFMTLLQKANAIQNNVFGIRLAHSTDPENNSELTIGSSDPTAYDASTLVTVKGQSNELWIAPADTVFVNGVDMDLSGRTAILDTGSGGISMPQEDLETLATLTSGANFSDGSAYFPCNTTFEFSFGGRPFAIRPQGFLIPSLSSDLCGVNIFVSDSSLGASWLLGDVFLGSVYSIFDFDQGTIGFAELV